MRYSDTFKARMVRRMLGPSSMTATELAEEEGIPQPTLSRWLREMASLRVMDEKDGTPPLDPAPEGGKRAQEWTTEQKLRAVVETMGLEGEALGAYLRSRGLYREQLAQWRESASDALEGPISRQRAKGEAKRIKELERRLRRNEKALAETAALLVLRKKANALWGDGDDDTDEKNEP
jgi:transposase-like protein